MCKVVKASGDSLAKALANSFSRLLLTEFLSLAKDAMEKELNNLPLTELKRRGHDVVKLEVTITPIYVDHDKE